MQRTTALYRHPLFWSGLLCKLLLLSLLLPQAAVHWYAPFIAHGMQGSGLLNPWTAHLAQSGDLHAFPYGYGMWLPLLPLSVVAHLLHLDPVIGYGLSLLLADVALLAVLQVLLVVSARTLLIFYWWSPIVWFATYWLGLNDVIPVLFLCLAVWGLRSLQAHSVAWAGIAIGAAISAKLSMVLALPFLLFYLGRHPGRGFLLRPFMGALFITSLILQGPFWLTDAARSMLLENPELNKVYAFSLPLGSGVDLYVLPIAYLLTVFIAWRLRRMHFEFLLTFLGVVFLLVLLLTPAAPGWFVWALPFLVVYQVFSGRRSALLVGGFGLLYVLTSFMSMEMPGVRGVSLSIPAFDDFRTLMSGRGVNLAHSALLAFGIALLWRLWKEAIVHHPGFRLDRKPLVIGIAGDSGAGKDALVDAMAAIFGSHSVVRLSGDDYHLWDRHKPMWQVMTHLNPRANDLAQFTTDLSSLINGRPILKRHYDHHVGRKSKPYRQHSNDIILVSGLHALYVPFLRDCYDLSIFLDIDETLRRYFKMRRDVHQRGHSADKVLASIERRRDDAQQFIHPQAAQADLVLALQPVEEKDWRLDKLSPGSALPPLKLLVQSTHTALEEAMARVLIAYCGLRVDLSLSGDHAKVTLAIEGDCAGADIALAARQLLPQASELLDIAPQWRDGIAGIMQLIVFAHAYQALQRQRS